METQEIIKLIKEQMNKRNILDVKSPAIGEVMAGLPRFIFFNKKEFSAYDFKSENFVVGPKLTTESFFEALGELNLHGFMWYRIVDNCRMKGYERLTGFTIIPLITEKGIYWALNCKGEHPALKYFEDNLVEAKVVNPKIKHLFIAEKLGMTRAIMSYYNHCKKLPSESSEEQD